MCGRSSEIISSIDMQNINGLLVGTSLVPANLLFLPKANYSLNFWFCSQTSLALFLVAFILLLVTLLVGKMSDFGPCILSYSLFVSMVGELMIFAPKYSKYRCWTRKSGRHYEYLTQSFGTGSTKKKACLLKSMEKTI